jgi:hypothetical protein
MATLASAARITAHRRRRDDRLRKIRGLGPVAALHLSHGIILAFIKFQGEFKPASGFLAHNESLDSRRRFELLELE